jgi:hypothetical protein
VELIDWPIWWEQRGADGIRRILMSYWDPVGVSNMPQAADEYDTYGRVVGLMLLRRMTAPAIAGYLRQVRTYYMLLGPGVIGGEEGEERARDREREVVETLIAWYTAEDSAVERP